MSRRNFPNWIDAYVRGQSISEAPDNSHFWVGAWTVAGALRRNVWFDAGDFDWTPNFYIVLVGPPGVIQKSTTASKGAKLLAKLPEVVFGPNSATWHGLLPKFQEAQVEVNSGGRSFLCSPLTMAISELGSFLKLSQEGLDAVLIDMWDGTISDRPWTHTTQTNGDKAVWNGVLNLFGCTTLGWVRESIPASALETGLISRILFVYADAKREPISIPNMDSRWNPAAKKRHAEMLVEDLREIGKLRGSMRLTPAAYEWQDAWYRGLWSSGRPAHLASERFDVYRSRKQSHMMKLAIVLTAAKGNGMEIGVETLQEALAAVEACEAGVVRIFETIGGPPEAQRARELSALVRELWRATSRPVTVEDLFRRLGTMMSYEELCYAVRAIVTARAVRVVPAGRGPNGRERNGLVPLEGMA